MEGTAAVSPWGWLRAVGLLAATGLFTVVDPWVLIAVPFGLLVLFIPPGRVLAVVLAAVGIALVASRGADFGAMVRGTGVGSPPGWVFPRPLPPMAGGTLPAEGSGRGFGGFSGNGAPLLGAPGGLGGSGLGGEIQDGGCVRSVPPGHPGKHGPGGDSWKGSRPRRWMTIALPSLIFPAVLGLASLSALGFAWWLHKRLGRNPEEGIGPLREFRFNDQLIWVLILGILALLASSGVLERIGANAVVFMGALYALRGAAVVLFLTGGISLFGGVLLLVGFLFVAPFVILGAVFFGLGDTWFDLRARRASTRSGVLREKVSRNDS